MFYLSRIEEKRLINKILPVARKVGVSNQLRGWSWHDSPLSSPYEDKIPMYSVCSKYCPSNRDIYLNRVRNVRGKLSFKVKLGAAIHEVVRRTYSNYIQEQDSDFDVFYGKLLESRMIRVLDTDIKTRSRSVWSLIRGACQTRFSERRSQQPYASRRDVMATAVPFLVEHRLSGELLGLSDILKIDCFDYLRNIVFDLKVGAPETDWYRLYPTGYALVLESVYEIPVDVGCVVYIDFKGDDVVLSRDLFFIDDDVRGWWVEERDVKQRIVAQKLDPGISADCPVDCIYRENCG